MAERPYEFLRTSEGPVLRVRARGTAVLTIPFLNRGTAFGAHGEGYLRLSYANTVANLHRALARIERVVTGAL